MDGHGRAGEKVGFLALAAGKRGGVGSGGGGTTALAAKQAGRKWITCELDEDYAAIATQRINEWLQ